LRLWHNYYFSRALLAVLIAGLWCVTPALAASPKVNWLFPAGAQRGQSVVVDANGEFPHWPVQVWSDHPGISATAEKSKGKLKITVDADSTPGIAWLRIYDDEGAAALRPFVIGTLPEELEAETNDLPDKPQVVALPGVVVNGRLAKSGDVDGYRVSLRGGQTLIASLQANHVLGSPMDSVLQVCEIVQRTSSDGFRNPAEAFPLEQNHDAIGLDPQIVFKAPRDGEYLVRLFAFPEQPNSTIGFAGGETYIYRLTLTTGGFVDHALPLAVERDEKADVEFAGWNILAAVSRVSLPAPAIVQDAMEPTDARTRIASRPELAGCAELVAVEHPAVLATTASDVAAPQKIDLPVTISGRLEAAGDVDAFQFAAKKSQKIGLRVEASSLGFPLDALLTVTDLNGKTLAELDDSAKKRDPELSFSVPADGEYIATIRDLSQRGGLRFAYRLHITPPHPDFSATIASDNFVLPSDKPLEIPLTIARTGGLSEAIDFRVVGLPAGIAAEVVTSAGKGDSAKSVKLVMRRQPLASENQQEAEAPCSTRSFPFRIEGKSSGAASLVRSAHFTLTAPQTGQHTAAWLTVGP
jgi:hypothetical protein